MKHPLIEVRNSPIHGRGVFARRAIRRGKRVIEYGGERLPAEDGYARYDDVPPPSHVEEVARIVLRSLEAP